MSSRADGRGCQPCRMSGVSNGLRMVARTSVPSGTRMSGPGICNGPPLSLKAYTSTPVPSSASGYQMPVPISSSMVNTPPAYVPAAVLLSLISIVESDGLPSEDETPVRRIPPTSTSGTDIAANRIIGSHPEREFLFSTMRREDCQAGLGLSVIGAGSQD